MYCLFAPLVYNQLWTSLRTTLLFCGGGWANESVRRLAVDMTRWNNIGARTVAIETRNFTSFSHVTQITPENLLQRLLKYRGTTNNNATTITASNSALINKVSLGRY